MKCIFVIFDGNFYFGRRMQIVFRRHRRTYNNSEKKIFFSSFLLLFVILSHCRNGKCSTKRTSTTIECDNDDDYMGTARDSKWASDGEYCHLTSAMAWLRKPNCTKMSIFFLIFHRDIFFVSKSFSGEQFARIIFSFYCNLLAFQFLLN